MCCQYIVWFLGIDKKRSSLSVGFFVGLFQFVWGVLVGFFVWLVLKGSGSCLLFLLHLKHIFLPVASNGFLLTSQNLLPGKSTLLHYTVPFLDLILFALTSITFQIPGHPS